jgi:Xaa-Pro dipeptidase
MTTFERTESWAPLTFDRSEYEARIARARKACAAAKLDALLLFNQESLFYLFGYDQIGYWVYQVAVFPADGRPPIAICRAPDELVLKESPFIGDVRVWYDDSAIGPGEMTANALGDLGLLGRRVRVGIEMKSHALLAHHYDGLKSALSGAVELIDASDIISELRLVKSPAEIALFRAAARFMDVGFATASATVRPGVRELDVHAAVLARMHAAGADIPALPPPIMSGPRTLMQTHGSATDRVIRDGEPFVIEIGAASRCYHAVGVQSWAIGAPPPEAERLHAALVDALESGFEIIRPGHPVGDLARHVRARLEQRGYSRAGRHVGYGTGIGYAPSWLDHLRLKTTDPHLFEPGMTIFYFIGSLTADARASLYVGEPVLVTESGYERVSKTPHRFAQG